MYLITVNQLLPEINWFAVTNFHEQDVDSVKIYIPGLFDSWFVARNIHVGKALVNLTKFFHAQIKVGLQYS